MFDDPVDDPMDEDADDVDDDGVASAPGLLPPRAASECLGHEVAELEILDAFNRQRLPHALVLSGPRGIGKATFAFRIARFLLSQGAPADASPGLFEEPLPAAMPTSLHVAPDAPVFLKVASGGHPDLLVVERLMDDKKGRMQTDVAVDEVRKITPFLRLTANNGGWRVVIVDDADTMTRSSQNAILKILEEPPPRTVLILVAHRAGSLLPTIRSRARVMDFSALDLAAFTVLLRAETPALTVGEIATLHAISGGSPGSALRLQREGGLAVVARLVTLLAHWPRWPWTEIHTLSETLGRPGQDDAYGVFVEIFLWLMQDLVRAKAGGRPLPISLGNATAIEAMSRDPHTLLLAVDALKDHFALIERGNLDHRQGVLGAFAILGNAHVSS